MLDERSSITSLKVTAEQNCLFLSLRIFHLAYIKCAGQIGPLSKHFSSALSAFKRRSDCAGH